MNIAETDEGEIMRVDTTFLNGPTQKGPAQQPKKTRNKPRKGTKPETKIPMFADVKLEVGDKVELESGVRTKVVEVDSSDIPYKIEYESLWCEASGENVDYALRRTKGYEQFSIAYKIIPYQEPSKEAKTPEQEAFEKGYWVANNGVMPDFVRDIRVEVLLSQGDTNDTHDGDTWYYGGNPSLRHYVVSYRKAKQ